MDSDFQPIDVSEAAEFNNEPVEAGEYLMTIKGVTFRTSAAGNPYINLRFEHTGQNTGRSNVFGIYMLSGKGTFKTVALLKSLGFSEEEAATLRFAPGADVKAGNEKAGKHVRLAIGGEELTLLGRQLMAVLKVDKDDKGNNRNEITALSPAS